MSDPKLVSNPIRFLAPPVGIGDTVLWKHAKEDAEAAPGIVTKATPDGTLSLYVMAADARTGSPRDGVYHEDDPRNLTRMAETGVWSHTRHNKAILALFGDDLYPFHGTPSADQSK